MIDDDDDRRRNERVKLRAATMTITISKWRG
jgi:hypothetical protein